MIRNLGYVGNPGGIAPGHWLTNPAKRRRGSRRPATRSRRNAAELSVIAAGLNKPRRRGPARLAQVMKLAKRLRSQGVSASEAMREAWRKIKLGGKSTMSNPRRHKSRRRSRRSTRARRHSYTMNRRRRYTRRRHNPLNPFNPRRRRSLGRRRHNPGMLGVLRLPKGSEWVAFAASIVALPYVSKFVVGFIPLNKIENAKVKAAVMIAAETAIGLAAAWGVSKMSRPVGDLLTVLVWYKAASRIAGEVSAGRVGTLAAVDFLEPTKLGFLQPSPVSANETVGEEVVQDVNDVPTNY